MSVRWIDAGKVSGLRSQSIYHGLGYAQTSKTPNTIVLATTESPYICTGHFQDPNRELDLDFCKRQNLPVIRRETGGGAVYIDEGQLLVQWVFQRGYLPQKVEHRFQFFLKTLIETYKFFGIAAYHYPINDVHVNGKKIVGSGAGTIGEAEVITGNFLFHFDCEVMANALCAPTIAFRSRVRATLEDNLTSFKKELGKMPDQEEVKEVYQRKCKEVLGSGFYEGAFTDQEILSMERIEKKFQEYDWLHQIKLPDSEDRLIKIHSDMWIGLMKSQLAEGDISILTELKSDRIEFIKIYPGFSMEAELVENLEKILAHTALDEQELRQKLDIGLNGNVGVNKVDWMNAIMRIKGERKRMRGYA